MRASFAERDFRRVRPVSSLLDGKSPGRFHASDYRSARSRLKRVPILAPATQNRPVTAIQTHPLYPFVSVGREKDVLEDVPFWDDETNPRNDWMVVAEATDGSRRNFKSFQYRPTIAEAEDFLFTDACRPIFQSWISGAQARLDLKMVLSLLNERRFQGSEDGARETDAENKTAVFTVDAHASTSTRPL
jgi:hypothetical protein